MSSYEGAPRWNTLWSKMLLFSDCQHTEGRRGGGGLKSGAMYMLMVASGSRPRDHLHHLANRARR